ncbi:hypothetical protein D3C84_1174120 [compost metagenome]
MLKLHATLKPRVLVTLIAVAITAFFSTEIIGVIASAQGMHPGKDAVDLDLVSKSFFPVGVLAFGIVIAQFLPIWAQPKS